MTPSADSLRKALFGIAALIVVLSLVYFGYTLYDQNRDHTASAAYYVSKENTVARVNTDASVDMFEQTVFTLNHDTSGVVVDISNMDRRDLLSVKSVKLSYLGEDDQPTDTLQLEGVAFSNLWRSDTGLPRTSCYAVDTALKQLYVINPTPAGKVMVTLEYTLDQCITPYRDVAERTWKLVNGGNVASTFDTSFTVVLPIPSGMDDAANYIFAWSHGPENATLDVSSDGIVTYTLPQVKVWQFAEFRLDFPTSWLANVSDHYASQFETILRLDTVMKTESQWVDSWHLRSINSYLFDIGFMVLCLLCMVFSVFMYFRHGRPRVPDMTDEYWNKPPYIEEKLHPSSVGQIWRWNRRHIADLHAAITYLAVKGAVVIEPLNEGDLSNFRISRIPEKEKDLKAIDQATLHHLFSSDQGTSLETTTSYLAQRKVKNSLEYRDQIHEWYHALQDSFDQSKYFEPQGRKWQIRLFILALALVAVGLGLFTLFNHPVLLLSGLSSAAAIALLANYLPRRTPLGNNITARAKALRNWMKADPTPEGYEVTAVQLQEVMPYASLLDLKENLILRAKPFIPEEDFVNPQTLSKDDQLWYFLYVTMLLNPKH